MAYYPEAANRAAMSPQVHDQLSRLEAENARLRLREQQTGYRAEAAEAQLVAALARAERLEKALEKVVRATDVPPHKDEDLVFIRACQRLARDFARVALTPAPAEEA